MAYHFYIRSNFTVVKKENVVCKQNCFFPANGQINLSKVHYTQENDSVLGFVDFNQIEFL